LKRFFGFITNLQASTIRLERFGTSNTGALTSDYFFALRCSLTAMINGKGEYFYVRSIPWVIPAIH
jgi:hypothetical protein